MKYRYFPDKNGCRYNSANHQNGEYHRYDHVEFKVPAVLLSRPDWDKDAKGRGYKARVFFFARHAAPPFALAMAFSSSGTVFAPMCLPL